jgi:hypothetical protein
MPLQLRCFGVTSNEEESILVAGSLVVHIAG